MVYNNQEFYPGQGNNSYIFPGVGLAVIAAHIRPINDKVFLKAAQCLAGQVSQEDLDLGRLYPHMNKIREVSMKIAIHVTNYAYDSGLANYYPKPANTEAFIDSNVYRLDYEDFLPEPYTYPEPKE